ncbi:MAG: M14 family metallopeptidase [Planctomycetes bacterium]|nr:M14 family metallopeptidase [Planctomycetota bacterium]
MPRAARVLSLLALWGTARAQVPAPAEILGFEPGEDSRLAPWAKIVECYDRLDAASPRVSVLRPGKSTLGRDFLAVLISSEGNLARLPEIREAQRKVHDPRRLAAGEEEALLRSGPAVVYVTCTIHSTEVASSFTALRLAHALATATDAETAEIRDGVLLVLVPSLNPDGIDIVHDWYRETLGTPWEGTSPPRLYHPYAGHDNNRDWYMLTQVETRLSTRLLYEEFLPEICYDLHQMGREGARLFVPPFADPINPNLDPGVTAGMNLVGTKMALDLAARGLKGIVQGVLYDSWWLGGNRNVPTRHNMIGILTESASANLASPVFQRAADLRGHGHDLPEYKAQVNFPDPWPGGWWRLRDIVAYQEAAARSLLLLAARERSLFKRNVAAMARRAIGKGRSEPPYAYLVPEEQDDRHALATLLDLLLRTGVEVDRAKAPFTTDGAERPAGTYVIPLAQPYRAYVKDLLERQAYPDVKESTKGDPIRPYDVAGWTLPLQLGLRVVEAGAPVEASLERLTEPPGPGGSFSGSGETAFRIDGRSARAHAAAAALATEGLSVFRLAAAAPEGPSAGDFVVTGGSAARMRALAEKEGLRIAALPSAPSKATAWRIRAPRVGLYQGWTANMDEGWTRWVLDVYGWKYATLGNGAVRAGDLASRLDAIVLPSASRESIVEGREDAPPAYRGGIGAEGVRALRAFVSEGGTLVCLSRAGELALQDFGLETEDVLRPRSGKPPEGFLAPGSILEVEMDSSHPLAFGLPARTPVFFGESAAYAVKEKEGTVVGRYPAYDPLLSGWLKGGETIRGKAALVEVPHGKGRVVLVGFRCQHRGQPQGTFKVLFNALLHAAAVPTLLP